MDHAAARSERFIEHLEPLQKQLEAYCRRSLIDGGEVQDALQSAVALAFRDFHRFAEGTSFRAWMFRYLNLEIQSRNRQTRMRPLSGLPEDVPAGSGPEPAAGEDLLKRLLEAPEAVLDQCDAELARAVFGLPEPERSTLLLRAIGEFRYREIAGILDIPVGSVMGYVSRARQRLRERLAGDCRQTGFGTQRVETDSSGGEP